MFALMPWPARTSWALGADFDVPSGQRQLFLDDYGIAAMDGLTRTMHQPAKVGAVIRPDLPWEVTLQTYCAPQWDPAEQLFKLWMITSTNIPGLRGMTYAESKDGVNWSKPILRQMEVAGSLENNFVTRDPSLTWPANAIENAVYDPDDPDPARRFKGLANARNREPIVSPDGIHWTKLDVPSIPSSDQSNMSYDRQSGTFIATVKQGGPYGRSVYLTTSTDFDHWTAPRLNFHADALDQTLGVQNIQARLADPTLQQPFYNTPSVYNVDVYNMGVFRYEGLYIGTPAMYHAVGAIPNYPNTVGFHLVQLACSRDLTNWKRLGNRQPFIGPSPVGEGNFDLTQIIGPSNAVVRGDALLFYYTGIKYRGEWTYVGDYPNGYTVPMPGLDSDVGAVCLAVLRRDGFISLDAGDQFGTVLTEPFEVTDKHLFVNIDAPDGAMFVQVLDGDDRVVATSDIIAGNLPFAEVPWLQGSLAELLGEVVSLRFRLRDGNLYSYALGPLMGDANGDGVVDDLDLTAMATHWRQAGGLAEGDFNDDGVVDELDLTVLAAAWPGGSLDASAVPEPATLVMITIGGLALLRRKRTR